MNEFKLLISRDRWIIINHIREIRDNPKRLAIYLLYLVWLGSLVVNSWLNYRQPVRVQMELGPQILGAGFTGLGTFLFLYYLYQGVRESSTFFTMGDVNLLFPAPVSPKNVLFYSMVKQSLLHFFLYGFMVLAFMPMLLNIARISLQYFAFLYCGFIGLILAVAPLKFLIFSLGSKYGIQAQLEHGILAIAAAFLLYLSGMIVSTGDLVSGLLRGLNAPFFVYLPVVGWSKAAFMTAVTGYQPYSTLSLLLQFSFIFGCIALSYSTSDDYYENVQSATEKRNLRKKRKEGVEKAERVSLPFNRRKQVTVKKAGTGPWALFWRAKVEYSRSDLHPYLGVWMMAFFLAGTAVGLAGVRYGTGVAPVYYTNGVVAYVLFIFTAASAAQHELTKPYIFLIPGANLQKIVCSNLTDVLRMSANALALNIPLGILLQVPLVIPVMVLFVVSFYILNLCAHFLIRILFPHALDQKAFFPLLLMLQVLLIILPGLIVGGILAAVYRDPLLVFAGIAAANSLIIGVLLLFSNAVFARLEWK